MRLIVLSAVLALCFTIYQPQPVLGSIRCTPPQLWAGGFGAPPRYPFTGDADADGYGDLLCVYPVGGCIIDVSLNASGRKCVRHFQAARGFGVDALGAVGGEFGGSKGTDVLAVYKDGTVRLAWDLDVERRQYKHSELLTTFPERLITPVLLTACDVDGDAKDEVVVVEASGRSWLISDIDCETHKAVVSHPGTMKKGIRGLISADTDGDGCDEIIYTAHNHKSYHLKVSGKKFSKSRFLAESKPGYSLCPVNLDDDPKADLIVGNSVIMNGNPKTVTKWTELDSSEPGPLFAADINGDGYDDLVRFHRGAGGVYSDRVYVHFTYRDGDPDPDFDGLTNSEEEELGTDTLNRDTDADGLLDGWEAHGIRDLNLPQLGCSPLHKDVICEIQPNNLPEPERNGVISGSREVRDYFAYLPVKNPDGKRGINFIPIIRETISKDDGENKGWRELAGRFFSPKHHGITHWMVVYRGGGGQSSQMGDAGSCGCYGFREVFLHEFGHQLGLDHTGFWGPAWCPIYTSLMNYAYNYSFEGKHTRVHYSYGSFSKLKLYENDLSEILPYRIEHLKFLANHPYHYRLKEDGDNTLVDWNWNGVFGEEHVRADINYGYSTSAGVRQPLDKTSTAPFLVSHQNNELLLLYGKLVEKAGPGSTASTLVYRRYRGNKVWDDPVMLETSGLVGDPAAASDGKAVWVFYPTTKGIAYRQLKLDNDEWKAGSEDFVPDSAGMQAFPCFYEDRLYVLLWSDKEKEVCARFRTADGWSNLLPLGFKSTFPVGAAVDTVKNEMLIGCGEDQDKSRPSRWQLRRFKTGSDGILRQSAWQWVEGENGGARGSFRPNIIFEMSRDSGPSGRVHFIAGGLLDPSAVAIGFWVAMQVADPSVNEGWLVRRYYDEWTQSRSAPAGAWFGDNIVIAYRWFGDSPAYSDNQIHMCYSGLGIDSAPMGDHDDISLISNLGLQHSILLFATKED